jgi:hypothetical protein
VIGRVADQHLAYAGNQFDLAAVRMDSAPAGAAWLREQGVDIALLQQGSDPCCNRPAR